jgi:hypothetical protein
MKDEVYIVLTSTGATRMTKRPPYLSRSEVGVRIKITVPDNAFRSPILTVDLEVPDSHVVQPTIEVQTVEPEV